MRRSWLTPEWSRRRRTDACAPRLIRKRWADKGNDRRCKTRRWEVVEGDSVIRQSFLLGLVVFLMFSSQIEARNDVSGAQASACDVTKPNDVGILGQTERGSYGNGRLSVGPFGLWPHGT